MITKTVEPPEAPTNVPGAFSTNTDVLSLLVLREIEAAGPLTGLEVVNAVASTARLLEIAPPGYALLHDLTEDGFLQALAGTPRRYRVTDAGEREAERLAQRCWPRLYEEVASLKRRLAPASPRVWPVSFVSEWTDDATD
ncbi:MAG: PadR family transcriptional regulator [Candidatus Limnocylindrales bacterium]